MAKNEQNLRNLNVTELKKADKKLDKRKKVIIGEGKNKYTLYIDNTFRQTKIQGLIVEFIEKFEYLKNENLVNEFDFNLYGYFLMIRHFTSFSVPKEFEKQIEIMKILIDLELLMPIIESFEQEEIKKLTEQIINATNNVDAFIEETNKQALENKDELPLN